MYRFTIEIANHAIDIQSLWKRAYHRSKDYLSDSAPEFSICASQEEIDNARFAYANLNNDPDPLDMDVELSVLLIKLADKMIDFRTLLIHGAVIAVNNEAYLFTAPSGTGKSTHVFKWLKHVPGAFVVNGDKPFVIIGDQPMVCGTPWAGKEQWQTNTIVPLKAIVLMERSDENRMRELSFREAFPHLMRQTHQPADPIKLGQTLQMLHSLSPAVKFYHFDFNNFKPDALEVSYHVLTGMLLPHEP